MTTADELASGARTVRQLNAYFRELKLGATDLVARGTAWQRGYFTPAEDEQIRWLLISYWQSRNALFDVVTTLRRDLETVEPQQRPLAFLVAFAGALLLVDGARFLREIAKERPYLRAKLNEAAPEFEIPAGCYDHVQASLLNARHAWHLYHAMRYYDEHKSELWSAAGAADADDMVGLVEEGLRGVQVPASQFLQARWKTRGGRIVRRFTSDLFHSAMYGLQKLGGVLVSDRYLRRGHIPGLPAPIADQVRRVLRPGDVLIVRKEFALTNYFLPGYWPHAALYLGTAEQLRGLGIEAALTDTARPVWQRLLDADAERPDGTVLESMKEGVLSRSLRSPLSSDSIVVLRPQMAPSEIGKSLARGLVHEGKPYDFDFDFRRSDRLVCTEVVYRSYDGIAGVQFPLIRRAGRPTLSGSDLIRLSVRGRALRPIAVYAPRIADRDEFLQDATVTDVLCQAERIGVER